MRLLATLLLAITLATFSSAADAPPVVAPAAQDTQVRPAAPIAELSVRDAVILGVVEGLTEFLPVSSTGHLIIATHALNLESEEPLFDSNGKPLWYKAPSAKHPEGEPLTVKSMADSYTVIIQIGAILAVLILYYGQFLGILKGLTGGNASGLRLFRNIILAFFPCAIIGLAIHDWIDKNLFSVGAVAVACISGAVLMFFAERWRKEKAGAGTSRLEPSELTAKQSLSIGLMQCLALWPGTSRSMVTMVGGYFSGMSPAKSAEFSFLVGLPTLAGAAILKIYKTGPTLVQVFGMSHILLGIAVAAVFAALSVKLLVAYLTRHGLTVFAVYRILLAAFLLTWFYT